MTPDEERKIFEDLLREQTLKVAEEAKRDLKNMIVKVKDGLIKFDQNLMKNNLHLQRLEIRPIWDDFKELSLTLIHLMDGDDKS